MIAKPLVGAVLWLATAPLPAQFFTSVGSEARRMASVDWIGMSGAQSVVVDYGQVKWRPEYANFMQERAATPVLLGKGALTTLRTDVDLQIGGQKLARGRWYLAARRDAQQQWSLVLFAADKVDARGRSHAAVLSGEPDLRVPVTVARTAESVELFELTLGAARERSHDLVLGIAWGPYRVRVEVGAAFDDRLPEGTPEFALTAAGKGTKTSSGLIHETLHPGSGTPPGPNDMVRVHYVGWLTDGTMFDSSRVRGEPATLAMDWVVKGFSEGLQLMAPGATVRLTIPPELAYGSSGAGERVPPGATLVFTVTLLGVDRR